MPLPPENGIDVNVCIARLATFSDETRLELLNRFKKHQQPLAKYQRRMACKANFSRNRKLLGPRP